MLTMLDALTTPRTCVRHGACVQMNRLDVLAEAMGRDESERTDLPVVARRMGAI